MANAQEIKKIIRGNTTSRLKGYLYQFMVALDYCFELNPGESLYVETYGDLAIKNDCSDDLNKDQLSMEIKMYDEENNLHLRHHNFLNTLFNWSEPNFHFEHYKQLVIFSTQKIRENDVMYNWNKINVQDRYDIVFNTYDAYIREKEAFLSEEISKSSTHEHKNIKDNIKQMKSVLYACYNGDNTIDFSGSKERLWNILERVVILEKKESYIDLYNNKLLKRSNFDYDKSVELINAMLGFILNPAIVNSFWQISYNEFRKELNGWANRLGGHKYRFPKIECPQNVQVDEDALFVKKLREINWKSTNESVREFVYASKFIEEEVDTTVAVDSFDDFKNDLIDVYKDTRGQECIHQGTDMLEQSRAFVYKVFLNSKQVNFLIYERTDPKFKKGVYHCLANDEINDIIWKLG